MKQSSVKPATTKNKDGLFLMEVLIDKVVFSEAPCHSDPGFRTCVSVECPSMGPLEICEDDCTVPSSGPFTKVFNSGKSCLFFMREAEIIQAKNKFPIFVEVFKTLPCGCIPTKIPMGKATIDMTKEFIETHNKFEQDPTSMSYQALKDKFQLRSSDGPSGEIMMYFRISCFGNMLVTKFQGVSCKPTLGRGGGADAVVDRSCNPERVYQTPANPCACGASHGHGGTITSGSEDARRHAPGCPKADDKLNKMPCAEEEDDPCFCCGPRPEQKEQMACRNTDQYCLHVPKGRSKEFEEVGTKVNGNELKIKVPASASIIKKISQTHCSLQRPYAKGGKDRKAEGACDAPCGKNQISLAVPCEAICCDGVQHQTTQFTCTTEGCKTVQKHGAPFNESREKNPNKDTYVLKVAKTAMQGDRKCRMEIELVAPKGPDKEPLAKKVDTRTQSEFNCLCGIERLKKQRSQKCCSTCCP